MLQATNVRNAVSQKIYKLLGIHTLVFNKITCTKHDHFGAKTFFYFIFSISLQDKYSAKLMLKLDLKNFDHMCYRYTVL